MSRFAPTAAVLGLVTLGASSTTSAVPIVVQAGVPLSIYDTGGLLNPGVNGGFTLGGLEVDPAGGEVLVAAANTSAGGTSTALRLIRSSGPGTAALDPSGVQPLQYASRGNDLTQMGGKYYVAARNLALGTNGVFGFTPGVPGLTPFAAGGGIPGWATSGLTFNPAGTTATVSSDVGIGVHHVNIGAVASTLFVGQAAPPTGYGAGVDDHVITLAGRVITIGDSSRAMHDITAGPGTVAQVFNFAPLAAGDGGVGSRGAVDPVSGDIFVAYGTAGTRIYRIKSDFSSAAVFATNFVGGVRDIDFGPASSGLPGAISLYATEVAGAVGSIYEFQTTVPEPASLSILALSGTALLGRRWRRRSIA